MRNICIAFNTLILLLVVLNCFVCLQVGEPLLDTSGGGVYSFLWTTKEACGVKPKNESGCDDQDTRLSMLKTKNKRVS